MATKDSIKRDNSSLEKVARKVTGKLDMVIEDNIHIYVDSQPIQKQ